jgi:hypothetical protein
MWLASGDWRKERQFIACTQLVEFIHKLMIHRSAGALGISKAPAPGLPPIGELAADLCHLSARGHGEALLLHARGLSQARKEPKGDIDGYAHS